MLYEKSLEKYKSESIKNTDIPTKKIKKTSNPGDHLISGVSGVLSPRIADIAEKKKTKDLTFVLGCAKRMG